MHEACGKCMVSLLCLRGKLRNVVLCPKCGIYQTTVDIERTVEDIRTADHVTMRIECPFRYVNEINKSAWHKQGEDDALQGVARDEYDDLPPEAYNTIAELQARILIPDKGPPQIHHTNGAGSTVCIALCNECYGGEHAQLID